ncbi:MTAP family purine nucleoside phosphorylase [Brevibacterium sp. RIT 803]|uniref:MTAP family purine nucleoside phosphorylase n=1 Tax=Brevibacterium sp. RIT 803 TaxID=2810210 RepID=UPI00194E974D|nr:MTAP family purine nucleoside phosphorylase [Brevibacterium sp. RIT 803]MBM6589360.1 MTAP family purine nucleoside phosphorylase [Brevibacterium sp. RIT 803]
MNPTEDRLGEAETAETRPRIAVIGGSGLYELLAPSKRIDRRIDTPYGPPSGTITLGDFDGTPIAFLSRHGAGHSLAPHEINYRANMWALASLGIRTVVSSSAVGSLNPDMPIGSFVIPDQMLDRTVRRASTYSGGGLVVHLPFSDPFTPELVAEARTAVRALGEVVADSGTTAVIEGPRFSTRAESRLLRESGGDIVNMTQYPEAALAGELGMGIVNLSFVTDFDAGQNLAEAVDASVVLDRLRAAKPRIIAALSTIVAAIGVDYRPPQLVPAETIRAILTQTVVSDA